MAQSLMAGGSRGSLFSVCLLVYVCLQDVYGVDWNRMDWLCAVSVYSRFQKAASYGALYFVFVCVCVCILYIRWDTRTGRGKGYEVRRKGNREGEGLQ